MPANEENIARFINSQERARKLIQMDAKGELESAKKRAIKEGKLDMLNPEDSNVNLTYEPKKTDINPNQMPKNTKLPQEILESMLGNKIDTSTLGNGISSETSILDKLNLVPNKKEVEEVKESYTPQTQQIDYSIIKSIVEESIRKYSAVLKKTIINENKNTTVENNIVEAIKIGNKFSFITKNGDLYEAKLKFIKHIE